MTLKQLYMFPKFFSLFPVATVCSMDHRPGGVGVAQRIRQGRGNRSRVLPAIRPQRDGRADVHTAAHVQENPQPADRPSDIPRQTDLRESRLPAAIPSWL